MKTSVCIFSLFLPLAVFLVGFVVWGFCQDPVTFPVVLGFVCLFGTICSLPFILLGFWTRHRRIAGKSEAGVLWAISMFGVVAVFLYFGWLYLYCGGPFHDGIIARGVTPDGRDYLVTRVWGDWVDGHVARYFVREHDGRWRTIPAGWGWDIGDKIAKVVFNEPYPAWHTEGTPFLRLKSGATRYLQEDPDHMEYLPASMMPEDLLAWHQKPDACCTNSVKHQ